MNSVYFLGISVVGAFFIAYNYIAKAGWSSSIKRVAETMPSFVIVPGLILIILMALPSTRNVVMHWTHDGIMDPASEHYDKIIAGKAWYLKGKLHRVGGPAIERVDNTNEWWFEGMLHRTDGPAIVSSYYAEWWYYNQIVYRITLKEDYITLEEGLPCSIIWDKNPITQKKVLTSSGIKYIPNLPGL